MKTTSHDQNFDFQPPGRWYIHATKRCLEVLTALLALCILSPLIIILCLLVKLDSPGSIFFLQQRVGKSGKLFTIFKFRTLFTEHFGLLTDQEAPNDYRITRLGKYLRRYKLDEIPQFLNVVLGNMSLVGPRPDLPIHVDRYLPHQHERFLVKPGMTGIVQVSGNTKLTWQERIVLDIWYATNRTETLDLEIIAYTFVAIVQGETLEADPFRVHDLLPGRSTHV